MASALADAPSRAADATVIVERDVPCPSVAKLEGEITLLKERLAVLETVGIHILVRAAAVHTESTVIRQFRAAHRDFDSMDEDTFASLGGITSIFALHQKLLSFSTGAGDTFQRLGSALLSLSDARGVSEAVRKEFAKVRVEGNDAAHPDLSKYTKAELLGRVAREYVPIDPLIPDVAFRCEC
jgi:hypothetical protein